MARGDRDLGKEHFWRGVVRRWEASKQRVRDFCIEQEVSEPSFYAWRRILVQRDRQAIAATRKNNPAADLPIFVPLTLTPTSIPQSPMLEVVLTSGRIVRVPAEFDASALRRILTVLEQEAGPC